MARFRLLAAHDLQMTTPQGLQSVYLERGAEIDSAAMPPGWAPTAWMVALDAAAEEMLRAECNRLRAEAEANNMGVVIGYGAVSTLPY